MTYTIVQKTLIDRLKNILGENQEGEDFFDKCKKIEDVFNILLIEDSEFVFKRPTFVEVVKAKIAEVRDSIDKYHKKIEPFDLYRKKEAILGVLPESYRERRDVEEHMTKVMCVIDDYYTKFREVSNRILYLFGKIEERYPQLKS